MFIDAAQPIADYELRMEQLEKAMRENDGHAPLQLKEPPIRGHYHPEALKHAYEIQLMTDRIILNPLAIDTTSLLLVDDEWLTDYLNFRLWVKYRRDYKKRPEHFR